MRRSLSLLRLLLVGGLFTAVGAALAEDTLKKLKDSGIVTMGVRESSGVLAYSVGNGEYGGFHFDLCRRILVEAGKAVGRQLEIRYQLLTAQNRIPLVQNGTVDLECGSTTNNLARQKEVSFAVTTFVEEVRMAVRSTSDITSIDQLDGKRVATTAGATSVQLLRKHGRTQEVEFTEIFARDNAEAFRLLESGRADVWVLDAQILAASIARAKHPADFKILGEVLSVEPIGIMFRKNDPAFKRLVDNTLKSLMASGEISRIYDKWFMQPIPPANVKVNLPASRATKEAWAHPNDKPMEDYVSR